MKIFSALLFLIVIMSNNLFAQKNNKKKKTKSKVSTSKIIQKGLPINSQWILESISKEFNTLKSINKNSTITIQSNKTKFNGNGGCNSIGGDVYLKNNQIKFSKVIRTEMYCDNMQQEDLFLVLLDMINKYKIIGGELFLFKDDKLVMTLESFR